MFTCIACSKEINAGSLHEQEGGDAVGTPRTKQAIKTLTSQDIALKASGAYKNYKPCSGSSNNNQTHWGYEESKAGTKGPAVQHLGFGARKWKRDSRGFRVVRAIRHP